MYIGQRIRLAGHSSGRIVGISTRHSVVRILWENGNRGAVHFSHVQKCCGAPGLEVML